MKQLLIKLLFTPILAFFPMIFSVAIIGTFWDIRDLEWLFPNKNAGLVYIGWIFIISVITVLHHALKRQDK